MLGWLVGWLCDTAVAAGAPPPPSGSPPDGPMPRQRVWVALSAVVVPRSPYPPALFPLSSHSLPRPPTVYPSYPLPQSVCPIPSPVLVPSLLVTPSHNHRT